MARLQIQSLQNARVKAAAKLRDRRGRSKQGRIVIDGLRELRRAVDAGLQLIEVYVLTPFASPAIRALADEAQDLGADVIEVPAAVFEKIAYGDRADGILGVAETPRASLDSLQLGENPLLGVLEQVEKPGNVGAALRSADAVGLSGLIVADSRTDLFNPNAIRASMGTIFSMPTAEASTPETINWLRQNGTQVVAAIVDASIPYTEVDFRRPTAIVLGSEADGLSDAWRTEGITPIRLPMLGIADSLNVSVAAAVLFYEALRQRSQP